MNMKLKTDNFDDLLEAMNTIKEVKSNLVDENLNPQNVDNLIKLMLEFYLEFYR